MEKESYSRVTLSRIQYVCNNYYKDFWTLELLKLNPVYIAIK